MDQRLIDPTGAIYLLILTMMAKLFNPEPRMLAMKVGSAGWLVNFLAGLIALGGFWFLGQLLRRFPSKSLAGINRMVFGKGAGLLFTLPYLFYFTYLAAISLREFVVGFRLAIMPRTPPGALTLIFVGAGIFIAIKGIEPLSRIAAYLFPTLALLFLFALVGPARSMNLHALFPLMGLSTEKTLLLLFPESSLYAEVIILGVLAAALPPAKVSRIGWTAMVGGIAGQTLGWLAFVAAFPYPMLARLSFPMLELVRLIEVSEILQRLEAFFVFLWFFVAGLKLALLLLCVTLLLTESLDLPDYRPLLLPIATMIYAVSFLPPNEVSVAWLDSYTLRVWSWPISIALPALTLLWAALSGKRGDAPGTEGNMAG